MKQTMVRKYNQKACDPFSENTCMDFCTAKHYIDNAYEKRRIVRKAIKVIRECELEGHMLQMSYFCGVYKQAVKEYRKSQALSIAAYRKCMAEIQNSKKIYG